MASTSKPDVKLLNDNRMKTLTLTVERRVLTESLHIVPAVHDFFTRHQLERMVRSVGSYHKDIVREFYASCVASLQGSLDRRANPAKHAPSQMF